MPLPTQSGGRHRVPLLLAGFSASDDAAGRMSRRGGKQDAAALEGHPVPPLQRVAGRRNRISRALGLAAAGMLLLAPAAFGAPPGNDDFANREVLSGSLPIEVTWSNVEATKEEGEPFHGGLGSKGHSVWFEWEATSDGFVTVGNCDSDFTTVLAVYTGTAVDGLTQVAGNYATAGGSGCSTDLTWGRQTTFEASAGTDYKIAVDGDSFYVPPQEPPSGEGTFGLQIALTPVPANDDFADAMPLVGSVEEEPGAKSAFYWASAQGYNWNADKEEGEPEHAGDPGGASVWYSWTAPATGPVSISTCAGKPLLVGFYTGASVGALTPVGTHDFATCGVTAKVVAGTTYRIAVDGELDTESGRPNFQSFSVNLFMEVPARPKSDPPKPSAPPSPDLAPPDTAIAKRLLRPAKRRATFFFRASEPGSTFRCKLDKRAYAPCVSPREYRNLSLAPHVLKVVAVDATGNVDPFPAVARFRIPKPAKQR